VMTSWAERALVVKNKPTTTDSGLVEAAFASRLAGFANNALAEDPSSPAPDNGEAANMDAQGSTANREPAGSDIPAATVLHRPDSDPTPIKKANRKKRASAAKIPPQNESRSLCDSSAAVTSVNDTVAWHIDKGALTLSEPRRHRDREHLKFVAAQPCLVCGRQPSDAHHLRFAQPRTLGRRVSDEFAVPLCRTPTIAPSIPAALKSPGGRHSS
jgi:hypothetical protein